MALQFNDIQQYKWLIVQVISGEVPSDKELGRQLMEVVQSIPNLDGDTITNMLNSHMQVGFLARLYKFMLHLLH